jgi:hypothetical protein
MELALLLSLVLGATIIGWLGFYLKDRREEKSRHR